MENRLTTSALLREVEAGRRLPAPAVARAIREAAGVAQSQIADELHVHRLTVGRWESGASKPRGNVRIAYLQLLTDLQGATS
ncbi:MAG: hypothetical protein JWP75_4153 [Frondihabitans sp.]|nr:hypothetical protein [Frondihabitans sp.]